MDTVDTRSASVPEDGEKIIELPSKSQGWECRTSEKDDSIRKKEILIMTERDYVIRSFKEITLNAA